MIDTRTNQVLVSFEPLKNENVKELPPVVKPPLQPGEIPTVEEVYLAGKRIEQFYNPRYNALDYYYEALKRDSGDIRTNISLGNHFIKNGDFIKARHHLSQAIRRLTMDYTRPSGCEALYLQGIVLKELNLLDEAIDTLYRATWDYAFHSSAYFLLSQISCLKGNYEKALDQINESLSTNAKNTRAIALKGSIQRKSGDSDGAIQTLNSTYLLDPLNFRIGFEYYLAIRAKGDVLSAEKELTSLTNKMRGHNQNYLNVAVDYIEDGFFEEAEEILSLFKGSDPEIAYYQGYVNEKLGESEKAKMYFNHANKLPTDYCFPYRLRTLNVLNAALAFNPKDAKVFYYTGNILYDKQPVKAIASWEIAVKYDSTLAIAYRNLGWGYSHYNNNPVKAIPCYEKAIYLEPGEAIYYSELDALYEIANAAVETRYKLFDGRNDIVRKRDDSFIQQMNVLTLAGQPERGLEYLKGKTFSYREGNSRVRETLIDAHLSLGIKYLTTKDFTSALDCFLKAQIPDEEAGSAKYGNRSIQINYFIGLAYEALKEKKKAKLYFEKAIKEKTDDKLSSMDYYLGLCYEKLGNIQKSDAIFNAMVVAGDKKLRNDPNLDDDFFAKFGGKENEKFILSEAYAIKGLGYKGLRQVDQAKKALQSAVEFNRSNLWASMELKNL